MQILDRFATCVLLAAWSGMSSSANAEKKKPKSIGKGFWSVLVKPGAKWVLNETIGEKSASITVETYDVRRVGGADVARLRWTLTQGKTKRDIGDSASGKYTELAVTPAGLYILSADMDDAKVALALKKKPSRSDPPKAYQGTKQNQGRYLTLDPDAGTVCMGEGPEPGAGECPDTCDATLCISATAGIVSLMGNWAPGVSIFEQAGYVER
jgi:hypothetical protein